MSVIRADGENKIVIADGASLIINNDNDEVMMYKPDYPILRMKMSLDDRIALLGIIGRKVFEDVTSIMSELIVKMVELEERQLELEKKLREEVFDDWHWAVFDTEEKVNELRDIQEKLGKIYRALDLLDDYTEGLVAVVNLAERVRKRIRRLKI